MGWTYIDDNITTAPWYKDANAARVYLHIIATAQDGQAETSLARISDETGLSVMQVRTALKKLEESGAITKIKTPSNCIVYSTKNEITQKITRILTQQKHPENNEMQGFQKSFNTENNTKNNTDFNTPPEIFHKNGDFFHKENAPQPINYNNIYNNNYNNNINNNNIKNRECMYNNNNNYNIYNTKQELNFLTFGTFGHVQLTAEQYQALLDDYGEIFTDDYISRVDNYLERTGKPPYKNFYQTIISWLTADKIQKGQKPLAPYI